MRAAGTVSDASESPYRSKRIRQLHGLLRHDPHKSDLSSGWEVVVDAFSLMTGVAGTVPRFAPLVLLSSSAKIDRSYTRNISTSLWGYEVWFSGTYQMNFAANCTIREGIAEARPNSEAGTYWRVAGPEADGKMDVANEDPPNWN